MSVVAVLAAAPVLAVIAIDDLRHHRIRNRYVLMLTAVTAAAALIADGGRNDVVGRAALGALLASAPLAAAWIAHPARIGGGDVKLAAVLGALAGIIDPILALAVVGVGLAASLVAALAVRSQQVALAPALATAFVVVAGSAVA